MTDDVHPISIMSETECWNHMAEVSLGRLVTSVDGQPEIFPVNFAVQGRSILFRTAEGTKLISTAINNHVLFEVDDHTVVTGWSVIVKGVARSLRSDKPHFVRIKPLSVTGRRFAFGSEPDRAASTV